PPHASPLFPYTTLFRSLRHPLSRVGVAGRAAARRPRGRRAMGWGLWVTPIVLLCLGLPIYLCFLAGSIAALLFVTSVPTSIVPQVMFGSVDSFTLLAVPFFLFTGELMGRGAIADRLVKWCMALFGGVRGSLGLVTVGSCVVFGAMSGCSAATVASIGRMMYQQLRENGYGEKFSVGLGTATGATDILTPPRIRVSV